MNSVQTKKIEPIKKKIFKKENYSGIENYYKKHGFCIVRGLYDNRKIKEVEKIFQKCQKIFQKYKNIDNQSFLISCDKIFEKTHLYDYIFKNQNLIKLLKIFYGNDIIHFNFTKFQLNEKKNSNQKKSLEEIKFQLSKGIHNDHWTGSSEYTTHYWLGFSGIDKDNTLTMYPGSHLNGSFPVLNREPDPKIEFKYKPHKLDYLKEGDVVLFHSLLLHKTTGKTNKTRVGIISKFSSLNYKWTNQEKDLGYQPLSIGPIREIIRLIGNDALTPFRTYGGVAGIDRSIYENYNERQLDKSTNKILNILKKNI